MSSILGISIKCKYFCFIYFVTKYIKTAVILHFKYFLHKSKNSSIFKSNRYIIIYYILSECDRCQLDDVYFMSGSGYIAECINMVMVITRIYNTTPSQLLADS